MDIDQLSQLGKQLNGIVNFKNINARRSDYYAAYRKQMQQWVERAEQALGKPLPKDFHDFYSVCERWAILESDSRALRAYINKLPEFFDKFRAVHPLLNAGNPEVIHSKAKKYAFYERIWLEECGQTQQDWDHFNKLARLKELSPIYGVSSHILVDFYDETEPYVFYHYDGSADQLSRMDLDLETFLTYFLYFDTVDYWYCAFFSSEDFKNCGVTAERLMNELNENYGQYDIYRQPIAEIAERLQNLR